MPPVIDYEKCTSCGLCDEICMMDVIYLKKEDDREMPYPKYPEECWHCGACRQDCPAGAISIRFPWYWLVI